MKNNLLSKNVENKLNELIGQELHAMYTYSAAANWCQENGFLRAYDFFLKESADEKKHSEILQRYMLDMGACPVLDDIDTPEMDYDCLHCLICDALEMEAGLGKMYSDFASDLVTKDFMTLTKVQEFIAIQTEAIGFYGDVRAAGEGLSKDKFQQLMLEKILVKY